MLVALPLPRLANLLGCDISPWGPNLSILDTSLDIPSSGKPPQMSLARHVPSSALLWIPSIGLSASCLLTASDFSGGLFNTATGAHFHNPSLCHRSCYRVELYILSVGSRPPHHGTFPFSGSLSCGVSLTLHCSPKGWASLFIPILQMQKLSFREAEELTLGHTASKWHSQDPNPGQAVSTGYLGQG